VEGSAEPRLRAGELRQHLHEHRLVEGVVEGQHPVLAVVGEVPRNLVENPVAKVHPVVLEERVQ
jgi:protein required for attachment to host cells